MRVLFKVIISIVLGLVATLTIFGVVIYPNLEEVHQLYVKATQKRTDLETLAEQILAYKNSQADLNAAQDKNKVLTRILARENLQVAIAEIESAAQASEVEEVLRIEEQFDASGVPISTKNIIQNENLSTEVGYTLQINGTFGNVLRFIQYMEHLPHFTEIENINFNTVTDNSSSGEGISKHADKLTVTIEGVFLVRKKTTNPTTKSQWTLIYQKKLARVGF